MNADYGRAKIAQHPRDHRALGAYEATGLL
jgi:hypothetical protein